MRKWIAGMPRFRSAPTFEEALCTSCMRAGDPDPYWPIDAASWPKIGGRFDLNTCLACRAERRRKAQPSDPARASVVACMANGAA